MKISYLLPKGTNLDKEKKFVASEIAAARRVKSRATRHGAAAGLRAIAQCL